MENINQQVNSYPVIVDANGIETRISMDLVHNMLGTIKDPDIEKNLLSGHVYFVPKEGMEFANPILRKSSSVGVFSKIFNLLRI